MKSSKRNKKAAMKSSKPNKDSSSSSSSSTIAVKKSAPEFSEHSLLHPAESAMKSNDTSSSNTTIAVKKSAPEFPRKPHDQLVYLEEFFKQRPENEPLLTSMLIFGLSWRLMSDVEKAPYVEEASKRNILYEKNMEAYNKWNSMSHTEKAPFLVKAKAPYIVKLAEIKKMIADNKWKDKDAKLAELKKTMIAADKDWNEDKEFDTFGFFIFREESENKSAEENKSQFYLFSESFVEEYKKNHPEDHRLDNVNVKAEDWWNSVPQEVLQKALDAWNDMSDADKAPYAILAEQKRNEHLHALYALTIFRNEYKKNNNGDLTACDNAWEAISTEEKAPYFVIAKIVLDGLKK